MKRRCDRNRKRSKRRAIYCPIHGCYLDSVSQKYPLFADRATQLQQRGMNRKRALLVIASHSTVPLSGEWLEAFWCNQCQETQWYHVCKGDNALGKGIARQAYTVRLVSQDLWQQVQGVIHPSGNLSVGEFTRRQSRMLSFGKIKNRSLF